MNTKKGLLDIFKKQDIEKKQAADVVEKAQAMLAEVQLDISTRNVVKLPIEQLGMLGTGVASVLPSLRTISQTITIKDDKLFRWVNGENAAGTLKLTKKDNLLGGAFIDKNGKSIFAKFQSAGGQTASVSTVMPIDPTTLMIAAVLMSIERKLDVIIEKHEEILSFLENDKEAEIEGDLKMLTNVIEEYKFNWDNPEYKAGHHQLAIGIKRTAEKNLTFYQKQIADFTSKIEAVHTQGTVDKRQDKLQKLFRYYRIALYIYSFASYLEVMLLGNFQSDYIAKIKDQIQDRSQAYNKFQSECYKILEASTASSVDKAVLNGAGIAVETVGKLIGSIPVIKEGQVDEWLVDKGANIKSKSKNIGDKTLAKFGETEETGCILFIENLDLVDKVYNKTTNIYIDKENVYLEV